MFLAGLASALIVGVATVLYETTTFKPRLEAQIARQAITLSEILLPTLQFDDVMTAEKYVNTRSRFPEIRAVAVYNANGERIVDYLREPLSEWSWPRAVQDSRAESADNSVSVWHAIAADDRTYGYLFMSAESPPLYARLPQYGIMAGAVVIALIAVSLLLLRGLNSNFLQPLQSLMGVTDLVIRHKDYAARAAIVRRDELGELASGMNEMLSTIQLRDQALLSSEQRLRSIVDNEPECVKLIGLSGELLDINPAGLQLLEVANLEEARSKPLIEFVGAANRQAFVDLFKSVAKGEPGGLEFELIGAHGARHWLEARAVPIRGEAGKVVSVLAISRDITERRRFESALKRRSEQQALLVHFGIEISSATTAEEFLQRAAEFAAQLLRSDYSIVMEVTPDGKIAKTRASHGWTNWYPGREWRIEAETPTMDVLSGDAALLIDDIVSDMRYSERVRQRRRDYRSVAAVRIRTPTLPWGLIAVHSRRARAFGADDVSALQELANLLAQAIQRVTAEDAQRRAEAQLLQSQKMEALGRLAGGIAHDFNNLLSAILGNAHLAKQDLDARANVSVSLEEIHRAGTRAKELVQRILAFSRQQEPKRELIALEPIVLEIARLLRATIPAGVELRLDIEPSAPPVLADAGQVHQSLLNLCTNAWQSLQNGQGVIEISLHECTVAAHDGELDGNGLSGRFVRIDVSDNGVGIDGNTRQRIFEPFFTTKPRGQGTGLGLSVVHGIMVAHHGAVRVKSEPGMGATFSLFFPVPTQATTTPLAPSQVRSDVVGGHGERIMYVDDEEPLVFLATRLLERHGYRVAGYTDPRAALEAFKREADAFDLVITDLSMPGITGMDLAREILRVRNDALVVLISGYVRQEDVDAAKANGIRDVILKPNTVEELVPLTTQLLSQR